jgi:hypothetical protein
MEVSGERVDFDLDALLRASNRIAQAGGATAEEMSRHPEVIVALSTGAVASAFLTAKLAAAGNHLASDIGHVAVEGAKNYLDLFIPDGLIRQSGRIQKKWDAIWFSERVPSAFLTPVNGVWGPGWTQAHARATQTGDVGVGGLLGQRFRSGLDIQTLMDALVICYEADGFALVPLGAGRWVVILPGIKTLLPDGSTGRDGVEAMGDFVGLASGYEHRVREAMTKAGVAEGDELVLAGHSQGGMVAFSLATDKRYKVSTVVAVGSPVGHMAHRSGVNYLSIVDSDDPVPLLDDAASPLVSALQQAGNEVRLDNSMLGLDASFSEHSASHYSRILSENGHPRFDQVNRSLKGFSGDGEAGLVVPE